MKRPALQKRIQALNVDMEWLNHNLQNVSGIAGELIRLDSARRISILGEKTFSKTHMNPNYGVKSPFSKSIEYVLDTEEYIQHMKTDVEDKLERLKNKLE